MQGCWVGLYGRYKAKCNRFLCVTDGGHFTIVIWWQMCNYASSAKHSGVGTDKITLLRLTKHIHGIEPTHKHTVKTGWKHTQQNHEQMTHQCKLLCNSNRGEYSKGPDISPLMCLASWRLQTGHMISHSGIGKCLMRGTCDRHISRH
jgi:hypothetical protein